MLTLSVRICKGPRSRHARSIDPLLRKELENLTSGICKALNDPKRLVLLYALWERTPWAGSRGRARPTGLGVARPMAALPHQARHGELPGLGTPNLKGGWRGGAQ